jgi:CheY-like chemotaxis protein
MKILIVDDNEPLTYILSAFLKREGDFEIESATDGDAAFKHYCKHGPYDLVVTDYAHEGMDGLELSRAIRKKNPEQAIAAFTADRSRQMRGNFRRLRIPVLQKPSGAAEIVKFLKDAIAAKPKTKKPRALRARSRSKPVVSPGIF